MRRRRRRSDVLVQLAASAVVSVAVATSVVKWMQPPATKWIGIEIGSSLKGEPYSTPCPVWGKRGQFDTEWWNRTERLLRRSQCYENL